MKIRLLILVICILLSASILLSSCYMEDAAGVINAEINENGELILEYANGSEQNLGVVVGKNGSDGADGASGDNGSAGTIVVNSEKSNISRGGEETSVSITITEDCLLEY